MAKCTCVVLPERCMLVVSVLHCYTRRPFSASCQHQQLQRKLHATLAGARHTHARSAQLPLAVALAALLCPCAGCSWVLLQAALTSQSNTDSLVSLYVAGGVLLCHIASNVLASAAAPHAAGHPGQRAARALPELMEAATGSGGCGLLRSCVGGPLSLV